MRFTSILFATVILVAGCGKSKNSEVGHTFDTQSRMFFINQCSAVSDPVKRENTHYMMVKRKLCTCVMERIESTMSFTEYQQSVLDESFMDQPKVVEAFEGCVSSQRQEQFGQNLHAECLKQLEGAEWPKETKDKLCACVSQKTKDVISSQEVKGEEQLWGILLESTQACGEQFPELAKQVQQGSQPSQAAPTPEVK